jgi:hypothetical protein
MNNTQDSNFQNDNETSEMLPEYNFDYAKAHPNRFAKASSRVVTLDPDVAEVFKTSEAVNHALRAIISAIPKVEKEI